MMAASCFTIRTKMSAACKDERIGLCGASFHEIHLRQLDFVQSSGNPM